MQTLTFEARQENCNSYCPLCGINNYGEEGLNPCEHLLFVYLNIADGIEYIREDIAEKVAGDDDFDIVEALCDLDIENGFVFIETENILSSDYRIGYQYIDDE
tara:strand:+ start:733 stop:1041 length:309 start_codon:yes stop_codon:yes gene_type:complete